MTRWLQSEPAKTAELLYRIAASDLREDVNSNQARALMHAAADIIKREILELPEGYGEGHVLPLHWSTMDRVKDAWACLTGRARVLRRV